MAVESPPGLRGPWRGRGGLEAGLAGTGPQRACWLLTCRLARARAQHILKKTSFKKSTNAYVRVY